MNRQRRARPPRLVVVTHQQHAELVATINDLVIEDALVWLHLPIAHAQLEHAVDRGIGRMVGVVHCWAIRIGTVCIFDSEMLCHRV